MEKLEPRLSPERIAECEKFIKTSVSMDYDDYVDFFEKNRASLGLMILDFFTLPKTDLHKEFRNNICKRQGISHTKKIEKDKNDWMLGNIQRANNDDRFDDDETEKKYKVLKRFYTDEGNIMIIGIPYSKIENTRGSKRQTKFAFTTAIHESNMPNLYTRFDDNMIEYRK